MGPINTIKLGDIVYRKVGQQLDSACYTQKLMETEECMRTDRLEIRKFINFLEECCGIKLQNWQTAMIYQWYYAAANGKPIEFMDLVEAVLAQEDGVHKVRELKKVLDTRLSWEYNHNLGRRSAYSVIEEIAKHNDDLGFGFEIKYQEDDVKAMEKILKADRTIQKPVVRRVIFNDPATIVMWMDGTKTVVKCRKGDVFNKETGLAMAYLKKMLGDDYIKVIGNEAKLGIEKCPETYAACAYNEAGLKQIYIRGITARSEKEAIRKAKEHYNNGSKVNYADAYIWHAKIQED